MAYHKENIHPRKNTESYCRVSVVVPVYQAKDFLPCCLESIIASTLKEWECILVDDGSSDGSAEICDEYSRRDDRFKVIHQENSGVSAARQRGIDCAIGEYVIHVDADDLIEPDMFECLYMKAEDEKADMVICDYFEESDNKKIVVTQSVPSSGHLEVLKYMYAGKIYGCCWNKLVRRNIIYTSKARFPIGVNHCEDGIFNAQLMLHDIKIVHLNQPLYHYRRGLNLYSIVMIHPFLFEVYKVRNKILFPILNPVLPDLVDKLKFQLKYLGYAEMRSWREYHDCYLEINERLKKEPYECGRLKAWIIYYTVKYKLLYEIVNVYRRLKKKWKIF